MPAVRFAVTLCGMTESDHRQHYLARMNRVLGHIDAHLDEVLDANRLAAIAAFSPFHFQRQFSALHGVGVGRYVQLRRLHRASAELAFRDRSVTEAALTAGYGSPEAFTRAFARVLGASPSEFRVAPDWRRWHAAFEDIVQPGASTMSDYSAHLRLIDTPAIDVAILSHRGDPAAIGDSLIRFIEWRRRHRLAPTRSRTFNVFHTPLDVDPADFRLDLCAELKDGLPGDDADLVAGRIPGGRAAVVHYCGSDAVMADVFDWLYRSWLPGSGECARDFPPYLERIRLFPDVPASQAEWLAVLPLAHPGS